MALEEKALFQSEGRAGSEDSVPQREAFAVKGRPGDTPQICPSLILASLPSRGQAAERLASGLLPGLLCWLLCGPAHRVPGSVDSTPTWARHVVHGCAHSTSLRCLCS